MHAIRVRQHGGPEVMLYEEVATPSPGPGEALVKIEAAGVNYTDIYARSGMNPAALPWTPGLEAAGTVEAAGEGVTELKRGDRVAWSSQPSSYAEYAIVSPARVVPVPAPMDMPNAAAALLQGMTAHYLTHSTYPIQRGDRVLVHAAAGGTGLLLLQMAKMLGAHVFGTVSTEAKAALAREAGADEVILYTHTDFEAEVKQLSNGEGVHAVYDSVGQTTFDKSLACLRPRGMLVLFGQASGPVPPVNPSLLGAKGSLFLTRPSLVQYTATRTELLERANAVLGWIAAGTLKLRIGATFPLAQAAEAHRRLESRSTTGKLLLIP